MSWEKIPGTENEFSGDGPWDIFAEALAALARVYEERFHRKPTLRELHRGLDFVLHGSPQDYIFDPEQLDASPPPPRRILLAEDFEAASGDMDGEVEPTFLARRSTGEDVVRAWLTQRDRLLQCEYEIVDQTLTDADVRWLFAVCYLKVLTNDYLAGDVDTIRFVPRAQPTEHHDIPYP